MLAEARREREAVGGKAEERYRRELAAYDERIGQARGHLKGTSRAKPPVEAALGADRMVAATRPGAQAVRGS